MISEGPSQPLPFCEGTHQYLAELTPVVTLQLQPPTLVPPQEPRTNITGSCSHTLLEHEPRPKVVPETRRWPQLLQPGPKAAPPPRGPTAPFPRHRERKGGLSPLPVPESPAPRPRPRPGPYRPPRPDRLPASPEPPPEAARDPGSRGTAHPQVALGSLLVLAPHGGGGGAEHRAGAEGRRPGGGSAALPEGRGGAGRGARP